jgi:hypothetical protein
MKAFANPWRLEGPVSFREQLLGRSTGGCRRRFARGYVEVFRAKKHESRSGERQDEEHQFSYVFVQCTGSGFVVGISEAPHVLRVLPQIVDKFDVTQRI